MNSSNKNNKINIITKYFYPVTTSIETSIFETYNAMAQRGWEVIVNTSQSTLTETDVLISREKIGEIRVRRSAFFSYSFVPHWQWFQTDLLCLHNFDVFPHIFILSAGMVLKILHLRKCKVILTPHGGFTPEWSLFPGFAKICKKLYHFTLGKFLINHAVDQIRVVSEWEKAQLIAKGIKPQIISLITNGVEETAYSNVETTASQEIKETVKNYGSYILQLGRIHPIKNYETVIKALPLIPTEVKFIIAGLEVDKKYRQSLEKLAKKLQVENRVIFAGKTAGADKYYLIKHAQMMIDLSIWESFSTAVHEGLSQGLICIVANNTAQSDLIKDNINGYCLPPKDHKALTEKINYILQNKHTSEIQEMMRRNRYFGLRNSWKNISEEVEKMYQRVLEEKWHPVKSMRNKISVKIV